MTLRQKYQRELNHKVRLINQNVANDDLWLGRFVMRQKDAQFERFEDGSGGLLYPILRIIDKKTGYYKDYRMDFAPYLNNDWHLWEMMNKFITEDAQIWDGEISPRDPAFKHDYREEKLPESIMDKPHNFYLSEEYWQKEQGVI